MFTQAGREWIVDATGCSPPSLRDVVALRNIVELLIGDLQLRPVAAPLWHVFPGEAGVTAMGLLAESHIALHTFPELGLATFNLYCCRPRAPWAWRTQLADHLGARDVCVRELERGISMSAPTHASPAQSLTLNGASR